MEEGGGGSRSEGGGGDGGQAEGGEQEGGGHMQVANCFFKRASVLYVLKKAVLLHLEHVFHVF